MQVTQHNDFISHAVIGGNEAIAFGISDSAEFFQILSSTLYSDQILAVVRETLCNAWDAHIDAGCTDIPVKVTLTKDKLTIRDFGKGIHHNLIGSVYGTYGGSTKTNDGKQTGGFGLGCKSPFAYVDHFDVASHHEGTKTLYALSKSSAEKMGKPGIMPVVSFPTTETGLEVSLDIRPEDYKKFYDRLRDITRNGEMNVELNGEIQTTLPMSKSDYNWIITRQDISDSRSAILIRYGNVIYPVETNAAYQSDYCAIEVILKSLYGYSAPFRIVFQAPPHSISVTPSRESLSMQEHTIKTIKTLLADFITLMVTEFNKHCYTIIEKRIDAIKQKGQIGRLLSDNELIVRHDPNIATQVEKTNILTMDQFVEQSLKHGYPKGREIYKFDIGKRLSAAIDSKFGKVGHIQGLRKLMLSSQTTNDQVKAWFNKNILRTLARDIQSHPDLDMKNLHITVRWSENNLLNITQFRNFNIEDYMPLQRNILVLTSSKKDILDKIGNFPQMKDLGSSEGVYVYHAPYAKTKLQAMRDFFTQKGFILLDLTVPQVWDPPKPIKPKDVVKKVKPTGYPALSGVDVEYRTPRIDFCFRVDAPRIDNPTCYLYETPSKASHRDLRICGLYRENSRLVIDLFGSECAVISTQAQLDKVKKAGIPELRNTLIAHVIKQITTSPQFLTYWPDSVDRATGSLYGSRGSYEKVLDLLDMPEVRSVLGLQNPLNATDNKILSLWKEISTWSAPEITKAIADISAMPISTPAQELGSMYSKDNLLELLDASTLASKLGKPNLPSDHRDRILKMIILALKG